MADVRARRKRSPRSLRAPVIGHRRLINDINSTTRTGRRGPGRVVGYPDIRVETAQQPQQTGVLFIMRQQVQPAFIMSAMHSQQA